MSSSRQRAGYVALLVCGGAVGAALAFQAGRVLEFRLAQEALRQYADTILHVAEATAAETAAAAHQFSADGMAFCSDDEIAAMRRFVYNAAFVKDIGRERDGLLYCTSGLGKLPKPLPMPEPVLSYFSAPQSAQIDIVPSQALALAPNSNGILVAMRGVTAVLNPDLYANLDNPPMHATGLARDYQHQVVIYAFGHLDPLSSREVLAQRMIEREGILYQPLCSSSRAVCIVASEARTAMLSGHRGYFISFPFTSVLLSVIGAIFGISIAASILLYFHRQRSLERRLRRAIRSRQIVCAYQPIVDLETHAIVGAEALARWTDDSGESVPPDVFIPVAEDKGFIGAVTRLILDRVFEDMGSLLANGSFHVTVNLSISDLGDPRFFEYLERGLKHNSIPPQSIGFEITERATALHGDGQAGIARLRATGHAVYLDDFGTGYSSLSYLHDLHADAIKIDRAFTCTVGTEAVTASVVPHILDMALRLKLGIVVEGIETEEQADYFRTAFPGARGQGWLFGRPVPALEFQFQLRMRAAYPKTARAMDDAAASGESDA
ncbi:MAG TPA: EAL domain-containing protein [Terracidiphilus sp.]|jgi:sensor c-di-GMP phosphodiesterase-like protein|nr:EAL domain-containing protein [Terracidiphilus sp.]